MFIITETPVPQDFHVDSVTATSACLSWKLCRGMERIPHSFLISYHSGGAESETITTSSHSTVITGLKPDTEYTVTLSTTPQCGGRSKQVTTMFKTGEHKTLYESFSNVYLFPQPLALSYILGPQPPRNCHFETHEVHIPCSHKFTFKHVMHMQMLFALNLLTV